MDRTYSINMCTVHRSLILHRFYSIKQNNSAINSKNIFSAFLCYFLGQSLFELGGLGKITFFGIDIENTKWFHFEAF